MAQKKELSQARSYIKSGKDFDKAEALMKGLLENKANRDDMKIYQVWFEAVRGQYTQANERLYLKQKQDTAAFFDLNYRMFTILETLDSLDMRPDKKGKVNPQYRQKNAELLNAYRPNIFNGGTYHLRKKEYEKAFNYYQFYIDCDRQPLFTGRNYTETDSRMAEAAYWACYSGYLMRDPVLTLRHRELALRDTLKAQYTLQYIAEARKWLNDQELYITALEEGFHRFPTVSYFFPRLMDAYTQENKLERALAIADSALSVLSRLSLRTCAKRTPSSLFLRTKKRDLSLKTTS